MGNTTIPIFHWYGGAYNAPVTQNAVEVARAFEWLDVIVGKFQKMHGRQKIAVVGFSQGACLALQYTWQRPQMLGTAVALTGSLMGETVGELVGRDGEKHTENINHHGLDVFLSCPENDMWVEEGSVRASTSVFKRAGANTHLSIDPPRAHSIGEQEKVLLNKVIELMAD